MIYIVDNAVAILIATLAGLVVAAVFYPRAARRTGSVATLFVAQGWFTAILAGALILAPAKASPWAMAIGTAVVIWCGFVAPAVVVGLRVRGVAASEVARDAAYWLVVMVVEAAVLHAIGLTAPAAP